MVLALFNLFSSPPRAQQTVRRAATLNLLPPSKLVSVTDVVIDGETSAAFAQGGRAFTTIMPRDAEITNLLIDAGVPVEARSQETSALPVLPC